MLERFKIGTETHSKNKNYQFWQYGNRGRLEGINGDVDFNVFRGTMEELDDLCYIPQNYSFVE